MKKFLIITATLMAMCSSFCYAQKKADSNYNLQKAYEVLQEEKDTDKALDLLDSQLTDTPNNIEALLLRARIYRSKEEYGSAMADVNKAITCWRKKSEIELSTLYWWKATIYTDLQESEKAANEYVVAIKYAKKDNKDNLHSICFDYAQLLFQMDKLDEAVSIYNQMLTEDENDQGAMVGLARIMIERKQFQDALDILAKCVKIDSDYSESYRFQMKAYDGLGETDNAIDASIKYFNRNQDANTDAIIDVMLKHKNYAVAKVKAEIAKKNKESSWTAFLCLLYEKGKEYELAVKQYNLLEEQYGKNSWIYVNRADCYSELGLFDAAIRDISAAVEKEGDAYTLASRADIYRRCGRYNEAMADYNAAMETESTSAYLYYAKGWCYELSGDDEKAMENYELGIDLDQSYPYIYLMRGTLNRKRGNVDVASKDFETVVAKDTIPESGSCTHYALHFLGRDAEALEWMDKIIGSDPEDGGLYYDYACLYARMGKIDESIKKLEIALEKGYCSFEHMERDDDMNPVRELPEYKSLIEKYYAKREERIKKCELPNNSSKESSGISEIDIQRHPGGTFEIPCQINSLPLQMYFDTGASDVTISSVEANFMLKNGYLSSKDIKGKASYLTANGDIHEGTVITLKEVKVGEAVLRNVDASVVKNQKAPLLLGQSALEKFGIITIDNINSKLIIKY